MSCPRNKHIFGCDQNGPPDSLLTYRFRYARRYCQSGSDRLEKQPTDPATAGRKACLFRGQDTTLLRPQKMLEPETSEAVFCLPRTRAPGIGQLFVDRRCRTPGVAFFKDLSSIKTSAKIPKLIGGAAFSRKHIVVAC